MVERLIPTLDVSGIAHEVSVRGMKWRRSFGYYADDSGISDSDNKKKLLLHYAGMSVQDIFDTVPSPNSPASVLMLDDHFKNEPTYALERHNFRLL